MIGTALYNLRVRPQLRRMVIFWILLTILLAGLALFSFSTASAQAIDCPDVTAITVVTIQFDGETYVAAGHRTTSVYALVIADEWAAVTEVPDGAWLTEVEEGEIVSIVAKTQDGEHFQVADLSGEILGFLSADALAYCEEALAETPVVEVETTLVNQPTGEINGDQVGIYPTPYPQDGNADERLDAGSTLQLLGRTLDGEKLLVGYNDGNAEGWIDIRYVDYNLEDWLGLSIIIDDHEFSIGDTTVHFDSATFRRIPMGGGTAIETVRNSDLTVLLQTETETGCYVNKTDSGCRWIFARIVEGEEFTEGWVYAENVTSSLNDVPVVDYNLVLPG